MTFMWPFSLIWLVLAAAALALVFLARRGEAFCLLPGALAAEVLSLFGLPWWVQVIGLAVAALLFVVCVVLLGQRKKHRYFRVEDAIGRMGEVTFRIENLAGSGEVEIDGLYWAAKAAEEGRIYEVGEHVTVIAVEGVKLICR